MSRGDGRSAAILAGFSVILFSPVLFFPGKVLGNFGDLFGYHYPLRHLVAARLEAGEIPLWNPYIFSGVPLLGNSQAAIFYPGSCLFHFFPVGYAFSLSAILHVLLAGIGMILLLRFNRIGTWGCSVLSISYAFSPFLLFRIAQGVPTLLAALSYVPWCWLAFQSGRRGALAFVLSLQMLSGHPQFLAVDLVGILLAAIGSGWRRVVGLSAECAGFLLLTLFQWAPTWEYARESIRTAWPDIFSGSYSLQFSSLLALLHPFLGGHPLQPRFAGLPSVYFECFTGYIGLTALVLAGIGFWRTGAKQMVSAWGLLGLGIFLAAGIHNPVYRWFLRFLPLGMLRAPARFLLLTLWGLLLAAAAGWRVVSRQGRSWRLKMTAIAAVLADFFVCGRVFIYAQDPAPYLAPNQNVIGLLSGKPWRVATGPDLSNPDKCMLYRFRNVAGYEAFYPWRCAAYAAVSEGRPSADSGRVYIARYDSSEMAQLGVRYYIGTEPLAGKRLIWKEGGTFLYENDRAYPLVYFADGRGGAVLEQALAEHWIVYARRPVEGGRSVQGKLVFAQTQYPGWRLWVNGAPKTVAPFKILMQSATLQSGGILHLRFWPTGWNFFLPLSVAGWLGWGIWIMLSLDSLQNGQYTKSMEVQK